MRYVVSLFPCVVLAVGLITLFLYPGAAYASNLAYVTVSCLNFAQTPSEGGAEPATKKAATAGSGSAGGMGTGRKISQQKICLENGIVFVLLPPGEFQMGSADSDHDSAADEGPLYRVRISRPFWIGKYEVTQKEWASFMGNNPAQTAVGGDHPVENVSWDDCQRFIAKLNAQSDRTFRLPSEAEWEYACRAAGDTVYCSGSAPSDLDRCGWYEGNSGGGHHPVGEKEPNVWGLYDMHGNVYEWCQDYYWGDYTDRPGDASAWEQANENANRVRRGGSYQQPAKNCRSAFRGSGKPETRRADVGLRLVMED